MPYSPQQNGVAKRANKTIMECARRMILAQGLELEFQGEAMNMVVHIKNRCPTKALDSKTPQEAWSGMCVSHLKVFGYKTFARVPDEKRTKLESKSMPCMFLGYNEGIKAYRLMCVETGAMQHMTFEQEWFTTYECISPRRVFMGDDTVLEAIGKGNIKATMQVGGKLTHATNTQVLHVPKMKNNLISMSKFISEGFKVEFDKDGCKVNNA